MSLVTIFNCDPSSWTGVSSLNLTEGRNNLLAVHKRSNLGIFVFILYPELFDYCNCRLSIPFNFIHVLREVIQFCVSTAQELHRLKYWQKSQKADTAESVSRSLFTLSHACTERGILIHHY